MEQELVGIQVDIAGKTYPLKIQVTETSMVKNVAENINEKINTLQRTYPRQDKQDYVSMAFLSYAIDMEKNSPNTAPRVTPTKVEATPPPAPQIQYVVPTDVSEKILQLNAFLDKLLEA